MANLCSLFQGTTSHSPKRSKNVQQKIIFHESPYSTLAWDDFTPPEGSSALCCGSALLYVTKDCAPLAKQLVELARSPWPLLK